MMRFFIFFTGVLSLSVQASECIDCTIKYIGCSASHQGKQTCNVAFEQTISGYALCAQENKRNRIVMDMSTDAGKALYSTAIAAYMAGKTVTHFGANLCTIWEDEAEDAHNLYMGDIK